MIEIDKILSHRLFGYGMPYQVEIDSSGKLTPSVSDSHDQALELSKTLKAWSHEEKNYFSAKGQSVWSYSMPFGRCGLCGFPNEHLKVFGAEEAYVDIICEDGVERKIIFEDDIILIRPLTVIRLRIRSKPGFRAIVAFQTEDQTPLFGNAGPYCLQGLDLPNDPFGRFMVAHEAFERTFLMDSEDRRRELISFFSYMSSTMKDDSKLECLQESARSAGSYDVKDQGVCFARQKNFLTDEVINRISRGDEKLFRFPGMFGAVAPLFSLLK